MEGMPCNWPECEYVATTDNWTNNLRAMECHERGKHGLKMSVVQAKVEEGGDAQVKKRTEKRAQAKLPMFEEVQTREEFKRKSNEFFRGLRALIYRGLSLYQVLDYEAQSL